MKQSTRAERAMEIEAIALQILEDKGYDALSILAVAKAAKASNETLYRWYGNKTGLFEALIKRNTNLVRDALADTQDASATEALAQVGPVLLSMLLGKSAVALNKAAAADRSGTLGQALAKAGRETVAPWIMSVMERGAKQGEFASAPAADMAEVFFALLIGDKQVRRVTGAMTQPSSEDIQTYADTALDRFMTVYGPK
ncbi:MAG: TetR/AcrR family transcriptional regulator [Paracoccaceae bacterium]